MEHNLNISLTLTSRDKAALTKIIAVLIEHGGISFSWDLIMRDTYEEYSLTFDVSGIDWFSTIHDVLKDIDVL